jgi:hypothetical protein
MDVVIPLGKTNLRLLLVAIFLGVVLSVSGGELAGSTMENVVIF